MNRNTLIVGFAVFAAGAAGLRGESAMEILREQEAAKVAALEAYLEANPEAEDRPQAVGMIVSALQVTGDQEALLPWMEERFEMEVARTPPDLQGLLVDTMQPLMNLYLGMGKKEEAAALVERSRGALGPLAENPQVGGFLDHLASQLDRPLVGDVMELSFTSTEGETIDLQAMDGKVVLVDFWATWCGPCVAEMPNVIAAYQKYKDRGFEVIGISLDESRGSLDQFVNDNGMSWPQYFDGKGWENELAGQFGITSIPATFLIGPDGKIAATDLRGPALQEEIEKLLN